MLLAKFISKSIGNPLCSDNVPSVDEMAKKWIDVTSCHGIPEIFQANSYFGKIFWALVVIGCYSVAVLQIQNLSSNLVQVLII